LLPVDDGERVVVARLECLDERLALLAGVARASRDASERAVLEVIAQPVAGEEVALNVVGDRVFS